MLILPRWSNGIWDPMELMQIVEPIVRRFSKLLYSRRGRRPRRDPAKYASIVVVKETSKRSLREAEGFEEKLRHPVPRLNISLPAIPSLAD